MTEIGATLREARMRRHIDITEVEQANGEPLDDQGREDLRTIARRQMLSDDPVTEPIELAQAGA